MEVLTQPLIRDRVIGAIDRLPPFSVVLNKVLASLGDDSLSLGTLASMIENDAVLAGNILRVCNSPLYARRVDVNSVRHAVSLIGTTKIRNLALGLSVTRRWQTSNIAKGFDGGLFNLHALAVAVMADQIALDCPVEYPEGAFVAGLLHDVGKLLIATGIPAEYEVLAERIASGEAPGLVERETLGATHAEISALVLEKWNLPAEIRQAVSYHHQPSAANRGQLHLAHVIQAADARVGELGHSFGAYSEPPSPADAEALKSFGLIDRAEKVVGAFQMEFDAVRSAL